MVSIYIHYPGLTHSIEEASQYSSYDIPEFEASNVGAIRWWLSPINNQCDCVQFESDQDSGGDQVTWPDSIEASN
jgi:hypothetical protein